MSYYKNKFINKLPRIIHYTGLQLYKKCSKNIFLIYTLLIESYV